MRNRNEIRSPSRTPSDIDELAAPFGSPNRAAGDVASELAAVATGAGVETEVSSRPGTIAAGPAVELDAQPARRGYRRVVQRVDVQADVASANRPTSVQRPVFRLAVRTCTAPAKPRWLLAFPDTISQLEQLDRQLLTWRDI